MEKLLEGKTLAAEITAGAAARVSAVAAKRGRAPQLAAVSSEDDYASNVYLKRELAACRKIGIGASEHPVGKNTSARQFLDLVSALSADKNIDAVLIPRPLPAHLETAGHWERLDPAKDIDGAATLNLGRLFSCKSWREIEALDFFMPCTAWAVVRLLKHHGIVFSGTEAVVLGRSSTVGKPLAHMLSCLDATVTLCHSRTKNLPETLRRADIVASAIGKARLVKAEMIKPGAAVADVGTNQDENGKFCGDVDFDNVSKVAGAISPVPGGVGPVTLACLLENIARAAERNL